MKVGIVCDNRMWADRREPHRALAGGLERLGCEVMISDKQPWPLWNSLPDVAFIWNGVHGQWGELAERLRREGVRTFIMERGFFDRFNHTQIDIAGFNHTASWASELAGPVPADAQARFVGAWGRQPAPMRSGNGYALVLLQTPGDAQLRDSEIRHPNSLVSAVEDAAPSSLDIRVRCHPMRNWNCHSSRRARTVDGTLADAVAGARFVITINSGAANEALAWGCPALCLGPALGAMAGAAKQTSLVELPRAIRDMAEGWMPPNEDVCNYLYWLASRQWTVGELAEGRILKQFVAEGTNHEL